jgi:hypothetical protein
MMVLSYSAAVEPKPPQENTVNQKKKFKTDVPNPTYLHEVKVTSGSKTYTLRKGQLVSVHRRPGLIAGKYEFLYADQDSQGLRLVVEGPVARERRYRSIRESDVKQVHIKTEARG